MHSIDVEMCRQFLNYCLIYCLLGLSITHFTNGELFLITPGDGEEFLYSPVDVNVTLHCTVNSMELSWEVGGLSFDTTFHKHRLHSRGIFRTEAVTSSDGMTESNVTVFGNLAKNNGSEFCCQSQRDSDSNIEQECTIIIIYGPPSPPELVPLQFNVSTLEINISWTALTVTGVDLNYTIYFDKEEVETAHSFYFYHQNTSDSKVRCSAYVTAVNGAGKSDPINNVTIPSLPDIGPVTASLSHQVWKSAGGEIMVNVSFKPALYCIIADPVLEYIVTLMSDSEVNSLRDKITKILLGNNKTEVTIETSDGLKNNIQYLYKVTVRNRVGNTTLSGNNIITSDVQPVTATVVGESTIDIQCLFIHGSDAVGCKLVLVSECLKIEDKHTTVLRKNASSLSTEQSLKLMHNISCYQRVFAVDIDVNDTVSNLTIEGRMFKPMTNEKLKMTIFQLVQHIKKVVLDSFWICWRDILTVLLSCYSGQLTIRMAFREILNLIASEIFSNLGDTFGRLIGAIIGQRFGGTTAGNFGGSVGGYLGKKIARKIYEFLLR